MSELEKHRTTILVDGSALIGLSCNVSDALKKDGLQPETYLDVLKFLGKNGYQIVIPEMTALETGQVLRNKYTISDFFPKSNRYPSQLHLKPFLRDAALPKGDLYKDFAGIAMATHTGPTQADELLNNLNTLTSNRRSTTTKNAAEAEQSFIRSQITALTQSIEDNLGGKAIVSLLESGKLKRPVFVVTNDKTLTSSICNDPSLQAYAISIPNFIYSFGQSGIARHAGFAENADGHALHLDRFNNSTIHHRGKPGSISPDFQFNPQTMQQKSALYASFTAFARQLDRQHIPASEAGIQQDESLPQVGSNRLDRYRTRYSNQQQHPRITSTPESDVPSR